MPNQSDSIQAEGPPLQALTRRLAECPTEFLQEPYVEKTGIIHVAAIVGDLMHYLGSPPLAKDQLTHFESGQRNWLSVVSIACWLLHDEVFTHLPDSALLAYTLLADGLKDIAGIIQARAFISDPDRREELTRICLSGLNVLPQGESVAQAEDRLETLSSVDRQRVIRAARVAEERAQAIREAMTRQAAEEAAAKYTRE